MKHRKMTVKCVKQSLSTRGIMIESDSHSSSIDSDYSDDVEAMRGCVVCQVAKQSPHPVQSCIVQVQVKSKQRQYPNFKRRQRIAELKQKFVCSGIRDC